ncbi:copper-binding protein [Uliginosibacterium sp. 31-12]|uniref:copper-binding protein n=1 Tax=Uliginosibacterium sp. 31-12 TaxID=3062781 RepID=UPI0026E3DE96|nr:copper-binding protein [Uliginosibacterium sp. 31-12]MDO6388206.1 copper-binding protein [Uliginosibacterium sp. 31-12]
MNIRIAFASVLLALASLSQPALAQGMSHDMHAGHAMGQELVPAEVRALDLKARKITLKHGDLKNLGMPGMTMVFALDKKLVLPADLKAGDKVEVRVEDLGGVLTVTTLKR